MKRLPVVIALLLIALYASVLPQVIRTNTVRHEDCLTGYRVEDC